MSFYEMVKQVELAKIIKDLECQIRDIKTAKNVTTKQVTDFSDTCLKVHQNFNAFSFDQRNEIERLFKRFKENDPFLPRFQDSTGDGA